MTGRWLWRVLALLSLLPAFALAQTVCKEYRLVVSSSVTSGWVGSAVAACNWYVGITNEGKPGIYQVHLGWTTDSQCQILNSSGNEISVLAPEQRVIDCGPPPSSCDSVNGVTVVRNITAGYKRTGGDATYPDLMPDGSKAPSGYQGFPPADMCVDGCKMTTGDHVASWSSMQPTAEGLYRVSDDYEMTGTGDECTPSAMDSARTDENAPTPACDGFKGYVDGRLSCVAKVEGGTAPPSPKKTVTLGNPQAGSSPDQPGSERIPEVNGNGGNKGGPPHPKDGVTVLPDGREVKESAGSDPTGTVEKPAEGEEQQACGAPGQPKCKIDETGTPSPVKIDGDMGGAGGKVDTVKTDVDGKINEFKQLQRPAWSWSFQLPTGCTPYVLTAFNLTLDVCEWKPMIHDLMTFVWGIVGVFSALGMLHRAMD